MLLYIRNAIITMTFKDLKKRINGSSCLILEKEVTEKLPDIDAALIEKSQENENNTGQEREQQEIQYEKSVEERRRKKKKRISG